MDRREFERMEYRLEQESDKLFNERRREADTVHGEEERRVKAYYDERMAEVRCRLFKLKEEFYAQPEKVRDPPQGRVVSPDELFAMARAKMDDYELRKARVIEAYKKSPFHAALLNKLINDGKEDTVREIVDKLTLQDKA